MAVRDGTFGDLPPSAGADKQGYAAVGTLNVPAIDNPNPWHSKRAMLYTK
jgi:hypothetical protein